MTDRSNEEIIENIKQVLEQYVAPAVAGHGGEVNFVEYSQGNVLLELSGACSGCAGSTMTLKFGVENMLKELIPEVLSVEGMDDPFSNVDPYYSSGFGGHEFYDEFENNDTD